MRRRARHGKGLGRQVWGGAADPRKFWILLDRYAPSALCSGRGRRTRKDQSPPDSARPVCGCNLGLRGGLREGANARQLAVQTASGFLFVRRKRERSTDAVRGIA